MRLSRIEIENFKGIGARQVIDLKPITLLFGANSAGKSTILQALHYFAKSLSAKMPTLIKPSPAGSSISAGLRRWFTVMI